MPETLSLEEAIQLAYDTGYKKGVEDAQILAAKSLCYYCGKGLLIEPNFLIAYHRHNGFNFPCTAEPWSRRVWKALEGHNYVKYDEVRT